MHAGIALMAMLSALKLGTEYWRLFADPGIDGARDLTVYHEWTRAWVAGARVYDGHIPAEYPPATYLILWPFFGWLSLSAARWLWAATTAPALWWLGRQLAQASRATTPVDRAFVVLMLLSINATGVAIGNGQLVLHVLPILMAAALLVVRRPASPSRDVLAGVLLALALVKPSLSVPFFVVALFAPGRLRPTVVAGLCYLALTIFAARFQHASPWSLVVMSLGHAAALAARGGYGNVHIWLAVFGWQAWLLPASALVLAAFALWTWRHRRDDIWLLLSMAAAASRLWTYHRVYDDALLIVPMAYVFRIARERSGERLGAAAHLLLAVSLVVMWLPARLSWQPYPWRLIFTGGHTLVSIASIAVLAVSASQTDGQSASRYLASK
jgi:hypothetical protein